MAQRHQLKNGSGSRLRVDNVDALKRDLHDLVNVEVLVGFPDETADRKDEVKPITNAALGYIHDKGSPEVGIPARPFMIPGIESVRGKIAKILEGTARRVLRRDKLKGTVGSIVEAGYHTAGLVAQAALRNKINEGIPPPLSDYTLRQRLKEHPGRKAEKEELRRRRAGEAPSTELVKPLIDTGQLRNAINYVIRLRRNRK